MAHLVFQTAYPGDLFLSIPLLKSIKDWDPQSSIVLACRPGLGEFFVRSGLVSEVIEIDKRSAGGRGSSLQKLRAREWDWIFVPHESVRTALWMTRLRARGGKIGFSKWWNRGVFTHRVQKPVGFPDALRQLSLLTPLDGSLAERFGSDELQSLRTDDPLSGLEAETVNFETPVIPPWASMQVRAHQPVGNRVFLAPGSVWNTKRWTVDGYEEVARQLIRQGYGVELVGSRDERALCEQIVGRVPGVRNRAGETSLGGLVDLLSEGRALVCNDSGAMHAAAATGLPTVAIFGPTVLMQGFRPWQNKARIVQRQLGCRPCGRHGARVCPIGTHECMKSIEARAVLRALSTLGISSQSI